MSGPFGRRGARRDPDRGQALVEFSLALIPFVILLMAVIDLGRGIYTNNGVAQAAREIARAASVHQCTGPCTTATWSTEIAEVVATQRSLLPGLQNSNITIDCVDVSDTPIAVSDMCPPQDDSGGNYIRVTVSMSFRLVSPILPVPNPFTVSSTAHVQVP